MSDAPRGTEHQPPDRQITLQPRPVVHVQLVTQLKARPSIRSRRTSIGSSIFHVGANTRRSAD